MISEYMEVGTFLSHWQAGVAVITVLVTGIVAYTMGIEQARAKQNKALKQAERSNLAQETLSIARLIDGVLVTVASNIDAAAKLADTGTKVCDDQILRRRLASPPLFSVAAQLDKRATGISKTYLLLCDKISEFRTETIETSPARLQSELEALRKIVRALQEEISDSDKRAQSVLVETISAADVVTKVA